MANLINKGNVSEFKQLNDDPVDAKSSGEFAFGSGTNVAKEDLPSKYAPSEGSYTTKHVDKLNVPDGPSQEFLGGHKSKLTSEDENVDDFGFVDEHSGTWLDRTPNRAKSAPNSYDDTNSMDQNSMKWINGQAKTFVAGLNKVQKATLVDLILHGFSTESLSQTATESDVEAIHRLLEQRNRFRKGSGWFKNYEDEIVHILKGLDTTDTERDPLDQLIVGHLVSPYHIDEFKELYAKAKGFGQSPEEGDAPEGGPSSSESPAASPAAAPSPSAQPSPSPSGQLSNSPAPTGEAADAAAAGGATQPADVTGAESGVSSDEFTAAYENDPQFREFVKSILVKYGLIDPQTGEVNAQANPQAEEAAKSEIEQYLLQNKTPDAGGNDPGLGAQAGAAAAPFGKGMPSRDEIRKAVSEALTEAQREQVMKSRVVPETQNYPVVNGKPISPAQLAAANFIRNFAG